MRIKNEKDFWSGVMFFAVGLGFAIGATNYDFGTAQRMGPAYFPAILGGLLAVLGIIVGLEGLGLEKEEGKLDKFHFGPIAWVVGSVALFGILLKPAGLLLSIIALVFVSMLGSHEFKWKEAVAVCVVMAAIVWVVFVYALNLTIPVWPAFMTP
ncbi:MAG TPA: tripartite tricarboxylate transporter TctB family protein [Burkholderiaceae bacterium]|nr:tripartite tricarboxylate transporter TctB family protein [Burkholderiaceae bacterium]